MKALAEPGNGNTAGSGTVASAEPLTPSRRARRVGRVWQRTVALVTCVLVAFGYSLSMSMHSLSGDTPLAYLGLVPIIALVIGFATVTPSLRDPDVHDRYLDRILAIPAIVTTLVVLIVLPSRLSTFFWLWRIDLLVFPLFVAGLVALLFGTRTLLRTKAAIGFLLLAWPVPYQAMLTLGLDRFTSWSVSAVRMALNVVPLAAASNSADGGFRINGAGGPFEVVVASQCSGANGLVGFLLVAGAMMLVTRGRWTRKVAWLAGGAAVVWVFNVVRILIIFGAGRLWGQTVAVDGFHPYVGLVTFTLSTALMVWVLPRFGLTIGRQTAGPDALTASVNRAVPTWRTSAACLLALSTVLGVFDTGLRAYDPVVSALGVARLAPFADIVDGVDGFSGKYVDHFDWATRYFGDDADWTRYEFNGPGTSSLRTESAVTADVVTTNDVQSFNDFGVEACYRFHGYDVESSRQVDLGVGQSATLLGWKDPRSPTRWTALYWFWPVRANDGTTTFQRVILLYNTSSSGPVTAPEAPTPLTRELGLSIDDQLKGARSDALDERSEDVRRFLVGFGRELVTASMGGS